MRLVLASASPRRAELLCAAGYDFDVVPADVDESVRDGEAAAMYVRRLAAEKSAAAMGRIARDEAGLKSCPTSDHRTAVANRADLVVLGADTAVVVDDRILGKLSDAAD